MERLRRNRGSADYRAARGVMRDILVKVISESYQEQLGRIPNRVRLVWGGNDREVPVEVAEAAARMLPSSQLEVLEGVGHFVPSEAPARLNAIIREELG
jgi:pimeloyl-ACP methyl ester carboxylesterase